MRHLLLATLLAACGADIQQPATGPAVGKADSGDSADHACTVVLDHVEQMGGPNAWAHGPDGRSYHVWTGEVLATAGAGAPAILYNGAEGSDWWEVSSELVDGGATGGFDRYSFRLDAYTLEIGVTASFIEHSKIQLIPFLPTDHGRLFDHNRVQDDWASYVLNQHDHWAVASDGTCTGS